MGRDMLKMPRRRKPAHLKQNEICWAIYCRESKRNPMDLQVNYRYWINSRCQMSLVHTAQSTFQKTSYTVWIVYTVTHLLLELTVWYLSGNSRLTAASTQLPHGKKNLLLTAACIRLSRGVLNACLISIWKPPSDGRLHTASSRYIEQPPANGRLAG